MFLTFQLYVIKEEKFCRLSNNKDMFLLYFSKTAFLTLFSSLCFIRIMAISEEAKKIIHCVNNLGKRKGFHFSSKRDGKRVL